MWPYKCGFLHCSFHQTGFESVSQRRKHENHHGKPWKCSIPSCEFEEGGFLSNKMRDHHLACAHETTTQTPFTVRKNIEETRLILLDLAKKSLVDIIKDTFTDDIARSPGTSCSCILDFCNAAGLSGSASMLKFCMSKIGKLTIKELCGSQDFVKALTSPSNLDVFKEFISCIRGRENRQLQSWGDAAYLGIFNNLLTPDSRPHFEH